MNSMTDRKYARPHAGHESVLFPQPSAEAQLSAEIATLLSRRITIEMDLAVISRLVSTGQLYGRELRCTDLPGKRLLQMLFLYHAFNPARS